MKNFTKFNIIAIALLTTTSAMAETVVGLINFTADTPAVADQVNSNFTAVKTAVDASDDRILTNWQTGDDHEGRINLLEDSSALTAIPSMRLLNPILDESNNITGYKRIGRVVGVVAVDPDFGNSVTALSEKNYMITDIDMATGMPVLANTFYTDSSCTGAVYTALTNGNVFTRHLPNATVVTAETFYVPKLSLNVGDLLSQPITHFSYISYDGSLPGCEPIDTSFFTANMLQNLFLALPNDPEVTGVTLDDGTRYARPLIINFE